MPKKSCGPFAAAGDAAHASSVTAERNKSIDFRTIDPPPSRMPPEGMTSPADPRGRRPGSSIASGRGRRVIITAARRRRSAGFAQAAPPVAIDDDSRRGGDQYQPAREDHDRVIATSRAGRRGGIQAILVMV